MSYEGYAEDECQRLLIEDAEGSKKYYLPSGTRVSKWLLGLSELVEVMVKIWPELSHGNQQSFTPRIEEPKTSQEVIESKV